MSVMRWRDHRRFADMRLGLTSPDEPETDFDQEGFGG
jgi:hypothetical protein